MKKRIFIDTDIGGDCDDAGALALANIFENNGFIDLVGMTYTTSAKLGAACISAINIYYGNPQIGVGTTYRKSYCDSNVNIFQSEVAKRFPNSFYIRETGLVLAAEEAVKFIRRKLSEEADGSVTFVCIGQLNNVSDLLLSGADEYSPLGGRELVKAKIKEFVVMGGLFKDGDESISFEGKPYEAEYNVASDVKSAQSFVNLCPVKIVFSDFKVGCQIKTGATLLSQNDLSNPVTAAYRLFQNAPRESWDLLAVWYAAFGADDLFAVSDEGTVKITDGGRTEFIREKKSNHFILRLVSSAEYTQAKLDLTLLHRRIYVEQKT